MGLADLFANNDKKEETAIQQINELEQYIRAYIDEYNQANNIKVNASVDYETLVWYVKGELLKKYMVQVEKKDKEAKYFFRGLYFKDYAMSTIPLIYNYFEKMQQGEKYKNLSDPSRRWKYSYQIEQGKAAEESLAKIEQFIQKFLDANQRSR